MVVAPDVDLVEPEPLAVVDPKRKRYPVRKVDEILALHVPAGDLSREPVVAPSQVRPWVMHLVGGAVGGGAPGGEVKLAVPERAEGLAQPFLVWVVAVKDKAPCVPSRYVLPSRGSRPLAIAVMSSMKRFTSSGSSTA